MKNPDIYKLGTFFYLIKFIILIQLIQNVSPEINNIILLSDNNFIYNHISINSEGDMIIDTSSSSSGDRKFYGLKKNGSPFFGISPFRIMSSVSGRSQGEAIFIKFISNNDNSNINECLAYIPQKDTQNIEYYLFEANIVSSLESCCNIFDNILSYRFSLLKIYPDDDTNLDYVISFIYNNKFTISQGYFDSSHGKGYNQQYLEQIEESLGLMVSCYFTVNKIYNCFYLSSKIYKLISFSVPISSSSNQIYTIGRVSASNDDDDDDDDDNDYNSYYYKNLFYKAIHVKEEIGAFIYFKYLTIKYPTIVFKQSDGLTLKNFLTEYYLNKYSCSIDQSLNDFIKLNNDQICYISTSSTKQYLYITLLTLYNSDSSVSIKSYDINMYSLYNIVFNTQIISNIYNGFITIVFNHKSSSNNNEYSSSFFILGYPCNEDYTFDVIEKIKNDEVSIDKLCFYLNEIFDIENNIFQYEFYGTQIIDFSENISLSFGNNVIQKNTLLPKDKCVTISFPIIDGVFQNDTYYIELAYVVKESINGDLTSYSQKTYTGKYSNYSLIISNDIYCKDDSCVLCDDSLECLVCQSNFNIEEFENKCKTPIKDNYISTLVNPEIEEDTNVINDITDYISQNLVKKSIRIDSTNSITNLNFLTEKLILNISETMQNCSIDDIIDGECKISISSDQITKIYERLKAQIKSNQSFILSTENVIFQISSLKEQKSNLNPNISSIDLGKCEEKIKQSKNLTEDDDLILYKIDIKSEDLSTTYVQYEIYDPKNFDYIDLDICEGIFINIYTPVTLKDSTESLFQHMSNSGYDLFNLNNSFYNDICTTYTTKDGTDLTLLDRKNIIYDKNGDISMCQEGCQLINYNSSLKKANCDCKVQTENTTTNIEKINFNKKDLVQSFYKTLKNSNFLVLKFYKLVIVKKVKQII